MGQTLTHGIYLPDEGERNCYSGLAGNWQILDTSVGTIAAHTTALSGKAPLVHTHTKSDITDFPALANVATSGSYNDLSNIPASFTPASHSHGNITNDGKVGITANLPLITGTDGVVQAGSFGTAANTFCEGNDSRLSDARTPVAHTHVKSDVTDLLNSNFIPSANNSYDLGSSSYQWNNVYAKGYYYNGTAWGLDKTNTWTGNQYYTGMVILNSLSDVAEQFRQKLPKDVSTSSDALVRFNTLVDSAGHNVVVEALGNWASYVSKSITLKYKNDSAKQGSINFRLDSSGHGLFYPESPFECDLGNSDNKWKSLNGINPGALSLPDYDSTAKLNLTSTFPAPDYNGNIWFTPTMSGWLYLFFDVTNATTSDNIFYAEIKDSNMANANAAQFFWRLKPADDLPVFFPVIANKQFIIQTNFTNHTLVKALLIPGMGHVA